MLTATAHARALADLRVSSDDDVQTIARALDTVFRTSRIRPADRVLENVEAIANEVRRVFPTRFAREFSRWRDLSAELYWQFDHDHAAVPDQFDATMLKLIGLLKTLLDSVPFVLLLSLSRLKRERLVETVAAEVVTAVGLYQRIYHESNARVRESAQAELLVLLVKAHRALAARDALGDEFIFSALLRDAGEFDALLPPRFGELARFLLRIRNRVIHGRLSVRPPSMLKIVYRSVEWAMLDLVEILLPICRRFCFVWVRAVEADRLIGDALSGDGEPQRMFFQLGAVGNGRVGFVPDSLFLIDRHQRAGVATAKALEPPHYMNVTPLLYYTAFGAEVDRGLFVLQSYEPAGRLLRYVEYGGGREPQLDRTDPRYSGYFEEYEEFNHTFLRAVLRGQAPIRGAASMSVAMSPLDALQHATWLASADHLDSLLSVENYDERGQLVRELTASPSARFDARLFVAPAEAASVVAAFADSPHRGLLLVGPSGVGKSNLLCSLFLQRRQDATPALFIDARRLGDNDIAVALQQLAATSLPDSPTPAALDELLAQHESHLWLFIDAINEYSGRTGPLGLLRSAIILAERGPMSRVKFVLSCRSEVWQRYREEYGDAARLEPNVFFTRDGEPCALTGFDTSGRQELYEKYQRVYGLQPRRYEDIRAPLGDLIRHPFLMRLIAETYSNAGKNAGDEPRRIPGRLDYFRLFRLLQQRKTADAKRLLAPGDPSADSFEIAFDSCLTTVASLIHEASCDVASGTNDAPANRLVDALTMTTLRQSAMMAPFLAPFSAYSRISVFDVALQVGVLERTFVPELDYWGNSRDVRAYKFFHDQYTQYCLAGFYTRDLLKRVSTRELTANPERRDAIFAKLDEIFQRSGTAFVLAGALEHWFYINMLGGAASVQDYLIPLFDGLLLRSSGRSDHFIAQFLNSLIDKQVVSREQWFASVFSAASMPVRRALADHAVNGWPELDPTQFRMLIEHCDDEQDDVVLLTIAGIAADHLGRSPHEWTSFLSVSLEGAETPAAFAGWIARAHAVERHLEFISKFVVIAVLVNFTDETAMLALRDYLLSRMRLLVAAALQERPPLVTRWLKNRVYRKLERTGLNQWDQAIGAQGGNNTFFVIDNGIVQRDALLEYFPFAVAYHNGDTNLLSLEPDSAFLRASMRLMKYRSGTVVGYTASVLVACVLRGRVETLERIVDELVAADNDSARYFMNVLATATALGDRRCAGVVLDLFLRKIIPTLLEQPAVVPDRLLTWVAIVERDPDAMWGAAEQILDSILKSLGSRATSADALAFARVLATAAFYPNRGFGERIVSYVLRRGLLAKAAWRDGVLTILAAMMVRSYAVIDRLIDEGQIDAAIIPHIRAAVTADLLKMRGEVAYQTSWNEFIVSGLTQNTKVRYFLVKILFGGLTQSNSVEEYAKEFRRLVIEAARGFVMDDDGTQYNRLTVEDALSSAESQRRPGDGQVWTPHALASGRARRAAE